MQVEIKDKHETEEEINRKAWVAASINTNAAAAVRKVFNAPDDIPILRKGFGIIYKLDHSTDMILSSLCKWGYPLKFNVTFEFNSKSQHISNTALLNVLQAWAVHEDFQYKVGVENMKLDAYDLSIDAVYGLDDTDTVHIRIGRKNNVGFKFEDGNYTVVLPGYCNTDILIPVCKNNEELDAIKESIRNLLDRTRVYKGWKVLHTALAYAKAEADEKGLYK